MDRASFGIGEPGRLRFHVEDATGAPVHVRTAEFTVEVPG